MLRLFNKISNEFKENKKKLSEHIQKDTCVFNGGICECINNIWKFNKGQKYKYEILILENGDKTFIVDTGENGFLQCELKKAMINFKLINKEGDA
jgi:hypothetical protein